MALRILLVALFFIRCRSVTITIDNKIINTTDERFVSFTLDWSQLTHTSADENFALTNKQVIYLASQYKPSILRVGGTQGDYNYYEVGNEDPCHLPTNQSRRYSCYSMKAFEELVTFAKEISADLIFGLSMGYPLYPQDGDNSPWNYTNTQSFLDYVINTKKYTNEDIYGFELGNEVNQGKPYKVPTVQSNAFKKLSQILSSMDGGNKFKLFGPDTHSYTLRESESDFDYIPNFASEACNVIAGLTYHCYVDQNESQLLTADGLNEQYRESLRVSNIFNNKSLCPGLQNHIIAGEIAEHTSSTGDVNILSTYYDGFWYLDALGTLSNLGHSVFARQTFAVLNYGLLDSDYNPRCDYYTGLLFHNLMDNKVLKVGSNDENLRIYAHCARNTTLKNGVAMAYVNINDKSVDISYDKSVIGMGDVYVYILTAYDSSKGLKSETMALNGDELKLDSSGKLPDLKGKRVNGGDTISVPKQSYGFFVFTQTTITACA